MRKKVYGVGIVGIKFSKLTTPLVYQLWTNVLTRVYSPLEHARTPTYSNTSIHPNWVYLDLFGQDIIQMSNWNTQGFQLDKDLTVIGNKEYGPDTCSFVPYQINSLFVGRHRTKMSNLPMGVHKNGKNYEACATFGGKYTNLGTYPTPDQAHEAYVEGKIKYVRKLAKEYKSDLSVKVYMNLRKRTHLILEHINSKD